MTNADSYVKRPEANDPRPTVYSIDYSFLLLSSQRLGANAFVTMAVTKRKPPAARPKIGAKARKKKSPRINKQSRPVITKIAKPCTTTTNNIFFIIPSTFYRLLQHKRGRLGHKLESFGEQQSRIANENQRSSTRSKRNNHVILSLYER